MSNATKRVYADYVFRSRKAQTDAARKIAHDWYIDALAAAERDEVLATLEPEPGAVVAPVVAPVVDVRVPSGPAHDALPEPPAARHEIVDFTPDARVRPRQLLMRSPEQVAEQKARNAVAVLEHTLERAAAEKAAADETARIASFESTADETVAPTVAAVEKPATLLRLSESPATDKAYADYDSRVASAWKTQPPKPPKLNYGQGDGR